MNEQRSSFESLSGPEKRIAIAKDALEQLQLNKIQAETGVYLKLGYKDDDKITKCKVCAKGSAFVSFFNLNGKCLIDEHKAHGGTKHVSSEYIRDTLEGVFSENQLHLMETAFEEGIIYDSKSNDEDRKALKFGSRFLKSSDRLEAIMQNVIDNGGEFKP